MAFAIPDQLLGCVNTSRKKAGGLAPEQALDSVALVLLKGRAGLQDETSSRRRLYKLRKHSGKRHWELDTTV